MALKNRIIVTLLHDGKGNAVKPVSFDHSRGIRKVGSLMQLVEINATRDIDELILIDIFATQERREPNWELVKDVTRRLYCPTTIGGNIHSNKHIRSALNSGADKVIIREALQNANFIRAAAKYVGSQSLVASLDIHDFNRKDNYSIVPPIINHLVNIGIGEICLTCMASDGKMKGYNLDLLEVALKGNQLIQRKTIGDLEVIHKQTFKGCPVPLIISGGCGTPDHMADALSMGTSAVAASSMYLYTDTTPKDSALYLVEQGYKVRVQ